jgi:hypothetical protein
MQPPMLSVSAPRSLRLSDDQSAEPGQHILCESSLAGILEARPGKLGSACEPAGSMPIEVFMCRLAATKSPSWTAETLASCEWSVACGPDLINVRLRRV